MNLNDGKVCPDCMAIAVQQAHEGYTWDEWIQFGVPKAGHTRCGDHCRCRLTPYLYVNVSTELSELGGLIVGPEEGPTVIQQKIIDLIGKWEAAGNNAKDLDLLGLTENEMLTYLESQTSNIKVAVEAKADIAMLKGRLEGLEGFSSHNRSKIGRVIASEFEQETGLGPCGAVAMAVRDLTGMPIVEVWVGDIATGYGHYANVTVQGMLLDFTPIQKGTKATYQILEVLKYKNNPELYGRAEMNKIYEAVKAALKKAGYL